MSEEIKGRNPFSADEFAAPLLAEVAAMDNKSIGKGLTRFIGYDEARAMYVWQDAFESMRPERLLGLYVLAQTLNDIEPLDPEPDPSWSPKRKLEHARHQEARRLHRVAHHQKVEQELRREGLEILSEYRRRRRLKPSRRGNGTQHASNEVLRRLYERKVARFKARREDLDACNTALEYVLRDREDVRLWCDVADVNVERFYRAVERRLLLKGRCSIELHNLLEAMREGRAAGPRAHDLLAKYEARAFAVSH